MTQIDYDTRWDEDHRSDDEKIEDETRWLVQHLNGHVTDDELDSSYFCSLCDDEQMIRQDDEEGWTLVEMFWQAEAERAGVER